MRHAKAFFSGHGFHLPPFAFWTPAQWRCRGPEADPIRQCRLGWDLTDFGLGDFARTGLLLFTVRNGDPRDVAGTKPYAEKAMIAGDGQVTPWHFHRNKQEDIINRAGARLVIELGLPDGNGGLQPMAVEVVVDGVRRTVPAGGRVVLTPGESITLRQGVAHSFYGEGGEVLIGEVSMVNDDESDNCFLAPVGRFPTIEADAEPLHLLCTEYP